jgi:DUF438 domain-containing protein
MQSYCIQAMICFHIVKFNVQSLISKYLHTIKYYSINKYQAIFNALPIDLLHPNCR